MRAVPMRSLYTLLERDKSLCALNRGTGFYSYSCQFWISKKIITFLPAEFNPCEVA